MYQAGDSLHSPNAASSGMQAGLDPTAQRIARYAISADFSRMPAAAIHECRRRLIDSIGCAAGGFSEPFTARIRAMASHFSSDFRARIWGTDGFTSLDMAAFANGIGIRYQDFNDTFLGQGGAHPSDMIGALVGVAEAFEQGGRALLTAIIVAYEVSCGLCKSVSLPNGHLDHATATAVGTAVGAGLLMGLDEARLLQAISLGLSPNLHLFNVRRGDLADWKGCAGPNGARNGVFAALLAREGVTGPSGPIEGVGGLFGVVGHFDWAIGTHAQPLICSTHLKFHPVCYHCQAGVDAAVALAGQIAVDDIAEIHVHTYEAAVRTVAGDAQRWAPATRATADHSLPYTIAVTLRQGHIDATSFEPQMLADPLNKRLMDRIQVHSSPAMTALFPAQAQTSLTVRMVNGKSLHHLQENPRGHVANPVSDAELEEKFIGLYAAWGPATAAHAALEMLWNVDGLERVSTLVDAVCGKPAS